MQLIEEMLSDLDTDFETIQTGVENEETRRAEALKAENIEKYTNTLTTSIDELVETYSNSDEIVELGETDKDAAKAKVDKYETKMNAALEAFLAQYTGDGTNIEEEFNDFVEKIEAEYEEVQDEINDITTDTIERKLLFGLIKYTKTVDVDLDGELLQEIQDAGISISDAEQDDINNAAVNYVIGQVTRDNGDTTLVENLYPGLAGNDKYKEAISLLENLEGSITPKDDYEKAKALIGRIYEISDASSVQLPEGIENLLRLPWFNNCNPVANIDSWIRQQGMKAIDIFTNSLIWESGCVGATFLNVKQKPRVTLVLNTCETISVSANAFGLKKMKEGAPIEIKRAVAPSGKFTVLELRRRNGHSWDIVETAEAVVSNINQKTHGAHFVALSKSNPPVPNLFYCPLKVLKNPITLGDTVCLRYIPGTKNFVFSVTKLTKSPPAELFKQVKSTVEFIAPNRSFGKLDNGVFLSNSLLSAHDDLTELSTVSGAAVRNFDHKKNEWSWMLLKVDEIENPN